MPGQFAQNFIEQCVERHWKVRFRSGFNGHLDGFGKSAPDFLTVASLFSQIISPHFILSFVSILSGMLKIAGPTLRTAYFNLQIFCSSTHYLHNEYHLSCLSKASLARQAHRSDICYLGQVRQLQCRPRVRSGCGWILWSHIQFFPRRLMFSFWTRQLSRAGMSPAAPVHARLIDQKGFFWHAKLRERTTERARVGWAKTLITSE